jgi:hypothetical protein
MLFVTSNNTPVLGQSRRVEVPHYVHGSEVLNSNTPTCRRCGVGGSGESQADPFPFLGRRNCISPTRRPPGLPFLKRKRA